MGNFLGKKKSLSCATTTKNPIDKLASALRTSVGKTWSDGNKHFVVKTLEYVTVPDSIMEGYILVDVNKQLAGISWLSVGVNKIRLTSVGLGPLAATTELEYVDDMHIQYGRSADGKPLVFTLSA